MNKSASIVFVDLDAKFSPVSKRPVTRGSREFIEVKNRLIRSDSWDEGADYCVVKSPYGHQKTRIKPINISEIDKYSAWIEGVWGALSAVSGQYTENRAKMVLIGQNFNLFDLYFNGLNELDAASYIFELERAQSKGASIH